MPAEGDEMSTQMVRYDPSTEVSYAFQPQINGQLTVWQRLGGNHGCGATDHLGIANVDDNDEEIDRAFTMLARSYMITWSLLVRLRLGGNYGTHNF